MITLSVNLISKYNVAVPRYTSYPTVPYWDEEMPSAHDWTLSVKSAFEESCGGEGISIYIHLPFCESLCTYCACNTRITVNHAVESPYIRALLEEWEMYLRIFGGRPLIREIHLGGGTPTFFAATQLRKLLEAILGSGIKHPLAEFSFEAHPGNTSSNHLRVLHELGFRRVSFGIQDFNRKVQDIINRKQSFEQVEEIVKEARDAGYTSVNFDLIYGLPLQTRASIIQTIRKVDQLKPDRIAFYSYAHVPWVKPGQRKFTEADLPVDTEKCALYALGKEMLVESGYEEIGMDHFALPSDSLYKASLSGTLHRNFMGYTHQYTKLLVGLGASSISDTWNGYMQNVKKVEEYEQMTAKGRLPVFKGHLLTGEDRIIRRHILNIMCRFETSWQDPALQFHAPEQVMERLRPLQEDMLVVIGERGLKVTKKGRGFLRNICAAFDERLWSRAPATQIFSTAV